MSFDLGQRVVLLPNGEYGEYQGFSGPGVHVVKVWDRMGNYKGDGLVELEERFISTVDVGIYRNLLGMEKLLKGVRENKDPRYARLAEAAFRSVADPQCLYNIEAEYRVFLKAAILKQDERYNRDVPLLEGTEPLRAPKGNQGRVHDRHFLWSDALWCGDFSSEVLSEFLSNYSWAPARFSYSECFEDQNIFHVVNEPAFQSEQLMQEWSNGVFDSVFREVMPPELHDVLEG
jgi:hypothetical protein